MEAKIIFIFLFICQCIENFATSVERTKSFFTLVGPRTVKHKGQYQAFLSSVDYYDNEKLTVSLNGKNFYGEDIDEQDIELGFINQTINLDLSESETIQNYILSAKIGDFEQSVEIITIPRYSIYIQTDKPIYKPGDEIRFRVFVIDSDLKLFPADKIDIEISDVAEVVKKTDVDISEDLINGVFRDFFEIATEPKMGIWNIKVVVNEEEDFARVHKFEVKEYVLPHFEVLVETKHDVTQSEGFIRLIVYANYTFGEFVKGQAVITARVIDPLYPNEIQQTTSKIVPVKFKKVVEFNIATELKIVNQIRHCLVKFNVEFEEELTKQKLQKEVEVRVCRSEYDLKLIREQKRFKPGFPFRVKAIVKKCGTLVDDNNESVKLQIKYHFKTPVCSSISQSANLNRAFESNKIIFLKKGVAEFTIEVPENTTAFSLETKFKDKKVTMNVLKKPSDTDEYLMIESGTPMPKIGEDFIIKTSFKGEPKILYYIVVNKTGIAHKGTYENTSKQQMEKKSFIKFKATKYMAPQSSVIVYYFHPSGEIVYDFIIIKLDPLPLPNSLDVRISTNKAKPGEHCTVKINSPPDSTVFFLGVDQSVSLLGTGNDITKEKIAKDMIENDRFNLTDFVIDGDVEGKYHDFAESNSFLITNAMKGIPTCLQSMLNNGESLKDIVKTNNDESGLKEEDDDDNFDSYDADEIFHLNQNVSPLNRFKRDNNHKFECGMKSGSTELISGGEEVKRGDFPWMVAVKRLKKNSSNDYKYICTGTLVSSTKVVTAAHCIQSKGQSVATESKNLILLFGAFDLKIQDEVGRMTLSPSDIIIHGEWNPLITRFSHDIAILILEDEICYSKFIRPICMLSNDMESNAVDGFEVGWGSEENSIEKHSHTPRKLKITITPNEDCFFNNSQIANILWKQSFCAGRSGKGVCRGDSGEGFFFLINNKFYFKGFVSSSISEDRKVIESGCYTEDFSVYTDVSKYSKFIDGQDSPDGEDTFNSDLTGIRKKFPDTWIFEDFEMEEKDTLSKRFKLPDTISTFYLTAFSMSSRGLGIAPRQQITIVQEFFVKLYLPYSIRFGEVLKIDVTVFNYIKSYKKAFNVDVKMSNDYGEFEFVDVTTCNIRESSDTSRTKSVSVPSGSYAVTYFLIRALNMGEITLKVKATTSSTHSDSIEKKMLVEAEGLTVSENKAIMVDMREKNDFFLQFDLPIVTENVIWDSIMIEASVIGDVLGPAIQNVQNLIQMPVGDVEKSLRRFTHTIAAMRYLKAIGKLTKDYETKGESYLTSGYQKLIGRRKSDGSYSLWGETGDSSVWLTAYVVKLLLHANEFIPVNYKYVAEAFKFLKSKQLKSGGFVSQTHDYYYMKTKSQLDAPLVAFVAIAFLENNEYKAEYKEFIDKCLNYLESKAHKMDNFEIAITAYALALDGRPEAEGYIEDLKNNAIRTNDQWYWYRERKQFTTAESPSVQVEIAAYAIMAFVKSGKSTEALPIVNWLRTKQYLVGGFYSYIDTVVGLQALTMLATEFYAKEINMNIKMRYEKNKKVEFTVDSANALQLQDKELEKYAREISLNANGNGLALVNVALRYNKVLEDPERKFDLTVAVQQSTDPNLLHLEICASFIPDGEQTKSAMTLIEVYLPSGYIWDPETADLVKSQGVRRTETSKQKTIIILYFDNISTTKICPHVKAIRKHVVAARKQSVVKIYDYNQINHRASAFYLPSGEKPCGF